jgi:hypothetical protein
VKLTLPLENVYQSPIPKVRQSSSTGYWTTNTNEGITCIRMGRHNSFKKCTCRRISLVISVPWRSSVISCIHFLNKVEGRDVRPLFLRCKTCWKKVFFLKCHMMLASVQQ